MAMNTFSMIPSVFSVSLKNVSGHIAFAGQTTVLPTGLMSRGQRSLPPQLPSMMRERYQDTAMPHASWLKDSRSIERGCSRTALNRNSKPAAKKG